MTCWSAALRALGPEPSLVVEPLALRFYLQLCTATPRERGSDLGVATEDHKEKKMQLGNLVVTKCSHPVLLEREISPNSAISPFV